MQSRPTLPIAVDRAHALWLWLEAHVAGFSTVARHGVGRHLSDRAVALMDALVIATYALRGSDRRRDALTDAQRHLAMLRLLLRGAREQRHLSLAQHDHAVDACAALGRMIAAWQRHARAQSEGPT